MPHHWVEKIDSPRMRLHPIGSDLTEQALQGQFAPLSGREAEVARVIEILARRHSEEGHRRGKYNPVLLHDDDDERFAIVIEVIRRLATSEAAPTLAGRHVIALDFALLLADHPNAADLEQRLREVFWQIGRYQCILLVNPVDHLFGGGPPSFPYDTANLLKPLFGRRETQLIGATTLEDSPRYIEGDAAMERWMQGVMLHTIQEPACP